MYKFADAVSVLDGESNKEIASANLFIITS